MPEHWIVMKRVLPSGETVRLTAAGEELLAIGDLLPVESLETVETDFKVMQWSSGGVVMRGSIKAKGKQICVATLEPMDLQIEADFERRFVPETTSKNYVPDIIDGEMVFDPEEDDYPDIVEDGRINAWDVLIEELNLAIDPYPRSENAPAVGAKNEPAVDSSTAKEPTHRPFSDLEALMTEKKHRS